MTLAHYPFDIQTRKFINNYYKQNSYNYLLTLKLVLNVQKIGKNIWMYENLRYINLQMIKYV